MTVRCIPEDPTFREDGGGRAERAAWAAVRDALESFNGATLFANLRIVHEDAEAEIDLLAVLPGIGVLRVETKAGTRSRVDGRWQQRGRDKDPFAQADRARHALLRRLKATPANLDGVRWGVAVAFPDMSAAGWEAADVSTGRVLDGPTLTRDPVELAAVIRRHVLAGTLHQGPEWTADRAATVVRFLEARLEGADLTITESDKIADRFAQQYDLLDMVVQFPRYAVVGGAGTGKTWLALEQARRWTDEGKRVALVCYTRGLAAHLHGHPDASPRKKRRRPAWIGPLFGLPVTIFPASGAQRTRPPTHRPSTGRPSCRRSCSASRTAATTCSTRSWWMRARTSGRPGGRRCWRA